MKSENYVQTLKQIKSDIIRSRYQVAKLANREMLFLYFKIGAKISEKIAAEKWGSKTIQKLSTDLQNEMKGLRGFSATNLKRMRQFFEIWSPLILLAKQTQISPLSMGKLTDLFTR